MSDNAANLEEEMDRVGLWYARASDVGDSRTRDVVWNLLTAEERRKHDAFRFEKNKHEYLVTRAVERAVLARYLGKPPAELAFTRTEYGRPELEPKVALRFNLTNTVHMVACAVATEREVGVDTEPLERCDQVIEVAPTVFTSNEQAMLDRLPLVERRRRAVELWTLKEAYMKARGLGMSLPVEEFEITFDGAVARSLRFSPAIDDDPSRWILAIRDMGDHVVSVCVERRLGESDDALDIAIEHADLDTMLRSEQRE